MATHLDATVSDAAETQYKTMSDAGPGGPVRRFFGRIRAAQFALSRRILFSWIKPTILGADRERLNLSDTDLVCYALPYRSTADLLVIDQAAEGAGLPRAVDPIEPIEARSFFFLGRPEGTLGRKSLRRPSDRMNRLFQHQQMMVDQAIKVVPVSIFWGHQPDREKSIFKLLLSEHWSATSGFKKFLAILFHRRHILVQFGDPIDLTSLATEAEEIPIQERRLQRLLRVHFSASVS